MIGHIYYSPLDDKIVLVSFDGICFKFEYEYLLSAALDTGINEARKFLLRNEYYKIGEI